ncbi:transposase [Streptomyces sp. MC1]|nr:transposase [Streptomyces sp. MC1]
MKERKLDWSRCVVGSSHVRAPKRGSLTGPSSVDRGRVGSKHHLITDGHDSPLAVILTRGSHNDITQLLPLLDAVPSARGRVSRPRRRAVTLYADRGYDHDRYRKQVRARGILPVIRTARHRARLRSRRPPVGGRADLCLAPRLQTAARVLGMTSRHPRSVLQTRLLPDHPPTTQVILLAVARSVGGAFRA